MKILKDSPNDYEEFCMLKDEYVLKIKVSLALSIKFRNMMKNVFPVIL